MSTPEAMSVIVQDTVIQLYLVLKIFCMFSFRGDLFSSTSHRMKINATFFQYTNFVAYSTRVDIAMDEERATAQQKAGKEGE